MMKKPHISHAHFVTPRIIKGFTLIEFIIGMVLLMILSGMAISSYSYLVQKNEEQTLIDELKAGIQYSKIQALILGKPVFLSPLDVSLNWSKGMALSAVNKKTNQMELLYQWQWHHPHWLLTWSGISEKIMFSNNPAQAISNGQFTLTHVSSHKTVVMILNRLGRVRLRQ